MRHTWALTLTIFTLTSLAFANETNSIDCEISLQQIIENGASCVKEIKANKIYLKKDCIFISETGVYALLNDSSDYAYIPELCTDAGGCFIQVDLMSRKGHQTNPDQAGNYKRTCPECGWKYFVVCQNPNCPLKKKNK
jgi:hypothetical protein